RDVTPCLGRSNKALTLYSDSHGSNTVNILMSWACVGTQPAKGLQGPAVKERDVEAYPQPMSTLISHIERVHSSNNAHREKKGGGWRYSHTCT
ncbi:hypothetical protein KUCAC02_023455, partial [Chaenocephalus aceratus]